MSKLISTPIEAQPGIQRDGTAFSSKKFLDGTWVRFYLGTPKKMGGYQALFNSPNIYEVIFGKTNSNSFLYDLKTYNIASLTQYPLNKTLHILTIMENELGSLFAMTSFDYTNVNGNAVCYPIELVRYYDPKNGKDPIDVLGDLKSPFWFYSTDILTVNPPTIESGSKFLTEPVFLMCPLQKKEEGSLPNISNANESYLFYCFANPQNIDSVKNITGWQRDVVFDKNLKLPVTTTGGIFFFFFYYLFAFQNDGQVLMNVRPHGDKKEENKSNVFAKDDLFSWSINLGTEENPSWVWNLYTIADTKIVRGENILASTPSAYLWSLNSVIRVNINDGLPYFSTVTQNVSILSPNSVAGVDNNFFWIGKNCFYQLSSSASELVNDTNKDWFFANLNKPYAARIFSLVNRKYSEIWWFFPMGSSTICNHIIIYNYLSQCWYDTPFNESTCALDDTYAWGPLIASRENQQIPFFQQIDSEDGDTIEDVELTLSENVSTVCIHEQGTDYVDNYQNVYPIYCSVRYPFTSLYSQTTSVSESWISVSRIELDIKLTGSLTAQMIGMVFPQDYELNSYREPHYKFGDDKSLLKNYVIDPMVRYIDFSMQGRLISLKLWCSSIGSSFHVGNMILN